MFEDDYDIDYDQECPKCGHSPVHSRQCTNWCTDGWFDASDDDPINYIPGEEYDRCNECLGTGFEVWCPSCGSNLSLYKFSDNDNDD